MEEKDYKKFIKRYDKFKKNNLPTYFWDDDKVILKHFKYTRNFLLTSFLNLIITKINIIFNF